MKHYGIILLTSLVLFGCKQPGPDYAYELNGTWLSGCLPLAGGESQQISLNILAENMTLQTTSFVDGACGSQASQKVRSSFIDSGKYDDIERSGVALNVSLLSHNLTFQDAGKVALANSNAYCGYTSWASFAPVSLLGKTCDGEFQGTYLWSEVVRFTFASGVIIDAAGNQLVQQ